MSLGIDPQPQPNYFWFLLRLSVVVALVTSGYWVGVMHEQHDFEREARLHWNGRWNHFQNRWEWDQDQETRPAGTSSPAGESQE